ncbi:pyridoxal 5'-phosphate synthase [Cnuibacter sp. UC19_7]|uniref:pyridoxine/pyridoxamine 5'-phosphate oxidase n=1 Tax=Cnuibacter sp. UC19_7 TaxID=3350166 RepID=UPI003671EAB6
MSPALPASAIALLEEWLPANSSPARPLMTLSTIGLDGYPDARTVLLSEWDESGFFLHTDSRSRKAQQLDADPRASLTLVWPEHKRQLVMQGDASPASADEQTRAYRHRSRYLQLLAWLNDPAFAALPEPDRVARWAAFDAANPSLSAPDTWRGYRVAPVRLTFWEGRDDAASRRREFTLASSGWQESLLPG